MERKFVGYITLICIALLSLLWVQYLWVEQAVKMKHAEFDTHAHELLTEIKEEIQDSYYCFRLYSDLNLDEQQYFYMLRYNKNEGHETRVTTLSRQSSIDTIATYYKKRGEDSTYYVDGSSFEGPIKAKIELNFEFDYEAALLLEDTAGGFKDWVIDSYKNTIKDSVSHFRIVDTLLLRKVVTEKMQELGATTYEYALRKRNATDFVYTTNAADEKGLLSSKYSILLYSDPNFFNPYEFHLYIPNLNTLVIHNLWLIIITSLVVVLVLVFLFFFFVKVMLKQRRLNVMKSDFIHNMTHEFNTPVSNINLALDTIDKQQDDTVIPGILTIIREENKRIEENISRILQTSSLEKESIVLQTEKLDVKTIIYRVVESFNLGLKENGGQIKVDIQTEDTVLLLDEVHFTNLLHNLLDNAVKYSTHNVEVELVLKKVVKGWAIVVKDDGIGINEEEHQRIFDRFYRVSTGNIHNVKGFGLGLHYVHQLIKAQGWKIELKSKIGKGSTFTILIPEHI
jgi:signal transduction histidine kinase